MRTDVYCAKIYTSLLILILSVVFVSAQPGCPAVNAGADVLLPCGTNCANLSATAFQTGATTSYTVSSIPYSPPFPYTGGTQIIINTDDVWSSVVNLPFDFCFYDNTYTQAVIGANGVICFDVSLATNYCNWAFSDPIPTPGTAPYNNSINGAYHDMDPSVGTLVSFFPPVWNYPANINYAVLGSAPCRTLVVNFSTVPHYSCNSLQTTQQIVLYETTNVIEVYIRDKPTCSGWNDGNAVIGLQNSDGTQGITPPGRNTGPWSASNEAWRFTPNGPSIVTIDWFNGATQIGTGNTVQVCPSAATTYTARATYVPCTGGVPVIVNDNVTVSLAGTLQSSITASQNVSCFGGSNGTATATVSGGTPPVTYGWTDGNTSLSRTGLIAGTYVFTATDASNCTRRDTVILTQPALLTVNVADVSQTNCSGTGTGTLIATSAGGTQPYNFVWNSTPAQNDSILNGVNAGTYSTTVTDANGCSAADNGTLTITPGGNNVALGNPVITNVACNGGNNGAISVSATGGSGVYTFTWGGGQTGPSISNLTAGQYSVLVDDGAGCTVTGSYNVTEPTVLLIDSANVVNIGCGGGLVGSISTFVSGGTAPYTFNWNQQAGGQTYTGQNINGLLPDTYTLTLTDANGCSATNSYTITQAVALTFTQSSTDATCNGGSDGSASISITSGTPPYSFNWNNTGATTDSTFNSASAGTVTVLISDAGCTATASFTIGEPTAIQINQDAQTDVTCAGGTNGTITVSATGGTPATSGLGYTFNWSNLQTNPIATGLSAGDYTVTVADANSCTASQTYTIAAPAALTGSTTVTNSPCYEAPGGAIALTVSGGTPPYQFLWTDSQTTQNATQLVFGNYTVTVVDNNGCAATFSDVITAPPARNISTSATAVKCIGDANGTITVNVSGGVSPYSYNATQDNTNFVHTTDGIVRGLEVGTYFVQVADGNGCTDVVVVVVPNATLDNFTTSTDSTTCYGDNYNDGAAYITATSVQNGPYEFSIDGGLNQYAGDFYNLSAGEHIITATNYNGCISNVPVFVFSPLPIVVDVVPDTLTLPLGESKGVVVNYLNALSSVTYDWTPASGLSCIDCPNPTVTTYQQTDYVVTVSSLNGTSTCFGSATLHVNVLPHEPIFVPNAFSPDGDGNNDVFLIFGSDIKTIDLKIFNRWGELVYKSNNAFDGWDGHYKGELQLPQVFTYTASVTFLDDKKLNKKGSIMLIR